MKLPVSLSHTHTHTYIQTQDISKGSEKLPIPVCDAMLEWDKNFNYITESRFDTLKNVRFKDTLNRCCDCTDNCVDKLNCSCWHLTIEQHIKRKPKPYDLNRYKNVGYQNLRLTNVVIDGIVECGEHCKCSFDKCVNRTVQRGLQLKLQVFDTKNRGHDRGRGVRTMTDLPPGTFVMNYYGEVIDDQRADNRHYRYHFSLGKQLVQSDSKLLTSSVSSSSSSSAKKARLDDDIVQHFLNFFPTHITLDVTDSDSDSDSEANETMLATARTTEYIIDSTYYGNVSRFFNVSLSIHKILHLEKKKLSIFFAIFSRKISVRV